MPYKHNCKYCQKEFLGRKNKQYCTSSCKNEYHNGSVSNAKEQVNADFQSLERNARILHEILNPLFKTEGTIFITDLKKAGFDMTGPFRYKVPEDFRPTFIVGDYEIKITGYQISYKRWRNILPVWPKF